MIEKFDYEEPKCPFCDGEAFYYPKKDAPLGKIPVLRIIEKVDKLFGKNNYSEAGRLLVYWKEEANSLRDKQGELAMESELVGYYRKQNDRAKGLEAVKNALALVGELNQNETVSGATIFINCATAYKAFGMAAEAMPLYVHAEQVYKKSLDSYDPRLGGLYNNMALALVDLKKYEEAEKAYREALAVMEKVPKTEGEQAITYINMAHMYEELGATEKISGCMGKAYVLLQSDNIPRDGNYAFILEKCAPSFKYFGDTEAYERLKKESCDIYEGA